MPSTGSWRGDTTAGTPVGLLKDGLPPRATSMVFEWAAMHQVELLENWRRLHADEAAQKVAPLE